MEVIEIFNILGIEETKDEKAIKAAYREKLAATNPEDDPEGFKRLRTAFEEAVAYINSQEETANLGEKDESISGLWVEKVRNVYSRMSDRRDVSKWEELFNDEVCLSIEEEENCRMKLLIFLMDNFRLPTAVWTLIDERFNIERDSDALRNRFPGDFISYVLRRIRYGEDVEFEFFEGAEDAPYDTYINIYYNLWDCISEGQLDEMKRLYEDAMKLQIVHPVMDVCKAYIYSEEVKLNTVDKEELISFVRDVYARYPKSLTVSNNVANILWQNECRDEAADVYKNIKADDNKHYMSNRRLTEWYYDKGMYDEAKECAVIVVGKGHDDEFEELVRSINRALEDELRKGWLEDKDVEKGFDLCWNLFQNDHVVDAEMLAYELEATLQEHPEKKTEYVGLRAKLATTLMDLDNAIKYADEWEKLLNADIASGKSEDEEADRDRVGQSHLIRMECYRIKGRGDAACYKKAFEEYEKQDDNKKYSPDVLFELMNVCQESGDNERGMDIAGKLINEYGIVAAAMTGMECGNSERDQGAVEYFGGLMLEYFPEHYRTYDIFAEMYFQLEREEDFDNLVKKAEEHGVKSDYLRAYQYQKTHEPIDAETLDKLLNDFSDKEQVNLCNHVRNYDVQKAEKQIWDYFYNKPSAYLYAWVGDFYLDGHDFEKANEYYQRANLVNPAYSFIYKRWSELYQRTGDYVKALKYRRLKIIVENRFLQNAKGEEKKDALSRLAYDMGRVASCYMLLGYPEKACEYFEAAFSVDENIPDKKEYARALSRSGRLEEAIKYAKMCYKTDNGDIWANPGDRGFINTLCMSSGNFDYLRKHLEETREMVAMKRGELFRPPVNYNKIEDCPDWISEYFWDKAMYCLLEGEVDESMKNFEIQMALDPLFKDGKKYKNYLSGVDDFLFAAILCKRKDIWDKYSKLEKEWLKVYDSGERDDIYADRPMDRLQSELLINFYDITDEEWEKRVESQNGMFRCDNCKHPVCVELKAVEILYLIDRGRIDEAKALYDKYNAKVGYTDYMRILGRYFDKLQEE